MTLEALWPGNFTVPRHPSPGSRLLPNYQLYTEGGILPRITVEMSRWPHEQKVERLSPTSALLGIGSTSVRKGSISLYVWLENCSCIALNCLQLALQIFKRTRHLTVLLLSPGQCDNRSCSALRNSGRLHQRRGGQKADDPARQFCVHCGGGTAGCHPQPRNAPGREDHCRCGDR